MKHAAGYDERLGAGVADRIEATYTDALNELERALQRIERYPKIDRNNEGDVLKMATALFAFGIYGNGYAILALYRADVGRQIPAIVRSQFEASVKVAYCEHHPKKALDFYDSEPFERWMTARGYTLRDKLRVAIEKDCLSVVRIRPELVKTATFGPQILAGRMPMDDATYRAVAKKLGFPKVGPMLDELRKLDPGWKAELYPTIYRIGSLSTHQSIGFLRDAFADLNDDGSIKFSIDQHFNGSPDYLLQSTNYVLGMCGKIVERFALEGAAEPLADVFQRHQQLVDELHAADAISVN